MENSVSIENWKISTLFHLCTNNYRKITSDICVGYMENFATFHWKLQLSTLSFIVKELVLKVGYMENSAIFDRKLEDTISTLFHSCTNNYRERTSDICCCKLDIWKILLPLIENCKISTLFHLLRIIIVKLVTFVLKVVYIVKLVTFVLKVVYMKNFVTFERKLEGIDSFSFTYE